MERYVIIVAGGKGVRMGACMPKQFLLLGDKPVLMHTIERFYSACPDIRVVLVLPQDQCQMWYDLCDKYQFVLKHTIIYGGATRFESVKNGLSGIQGKGVVAIHDGVRPFVSLSVIRRCFELAEKYSAVVPVLDMLESIRRVLSNGSEAVDRTQYKVVQTPQVFDIELLQRAYLQDYVSTFTDDASVVENLGVPIMLTEGNRENIKITTPFDLKIGKTLLECLI